jgi:hypothetical protein
VRLTAAHDPLAGDRNGETLSDADLAALAVEPERYRRNTAAVWAEHPHVSDDAFRAGRARIIGALLAAPALYRTPVGRHQWEQRARANLAAKPTPFDPRNAGRDIMVDELDLAWALATRSPCIWTPRAGTTPTSLSASAKCSPRSPCSSRSSRAKGPSYQPI